MYASSLPLEVGQNPSSLTLLDGLDLEVGQLVPPQGATDQQCQEPDNTFRGLIAVDPGGAGRVN
jgi:hypothetical protein